MLELQTTVEMRTTVPGLKQTPMKFELEGVCKAIGASVTQYSHHDGSPNTRHTVKRARAFHTVTPWLKIAPSIWVQWPWASHLLPLFSHQGRFLKFFLGVLLCSGLSPYQSQQVAL